MAMTIGIAGCNQANEKKSEKPHLPQVAANCFVYSFMEGVSMCSNDSIYIIKGTVLNKIEYGLNIRLIEDFKGNFPKNINTFIVWGDGNGFLESNRMDNLTLYKKQDVLIMLLNPVSDLPPEMIPKGHTWLEKLEDYATLTCTCSVLKSSDGHVSGYILANDELWGIEQTMQYEDFQKKLNELLMIE